MKKYAIVFSVTYLVATVFFIFVSYFLRFKVLDGFNIAAVFSGVFYAGHVFFKDQSRVPTKEEAAQLARYSLLSVLLVLCIVIMYLISNFAAHAIIAFITNPRYLLMSTSATMLLFSIYYMVIRYSFVWFVKSAVKRVTPQV
jgi:hypothetical protein